LSQQYGYWNKKAPPCFDHGRVKPLDLITSFLFSLDIPGSNAETGQYATLAKILETQSKDSTRH
jgi:hypothetical protein